jgi:hypothetical protein
VLIQSIPKFSSSGSVSPGEIFKVIKEKEDSIIAPYLIEYISDLEKGSGGQLSFPEFVRSIAKFCLYTPTQIIQCNKQSVVFMCIDENRGGTVTKEEIIFFLKRTINGKMVFPSSYLKSVELYETERSDLIDWSNLQTGEFVKMSREVPYLVFPAFRLQNTLRMYTLGRLTWKRVYQDLLDRKRNEAKRQEEEQEHEREQQEKVWALQIEEWERRDLE